MEVLNCTQFGNPLLRATAKPVKVSAIGSAKIQRLIKDMRHTLIKKKFGVGLAAPQVGENLALAVVAIRPLPHRPKAKVFDLVLINPEIIEEYGRKSQLWEGCISSGHGEETGLFAKVPRYKEIRVRYYDETGELHTKKFKGLPAHVIQHEVDHLSGILFVDKVKDTKSYMTFAEYKKMKKKKLVD